jgi:hypothetical protein
MRVRLFGKNSDDKGTQLEKLTQRLLERLGYRQIVLNFVGSGGSEIDIRAEYPLPGIGGEKVAHLVGECKAYEATVSLPEWLKFLGKIFTEKASKNNDVHGLFIALSGVNGNVHGAYDDLRVHDETVQLISGDHLASQVRTEFNLPDVSSFILRVGSLTRDAIATASLGYYENRAFWIAEFVNSTFTVLLGDALDQVPSAELIEVITGQIQAAQYRDIFQEQLANDRITFARKYVLGQLLNGQSIDLPLREDLPALPVPLLQSDIEKACSLLRAEGKLIEGSTELRLCDLASDLGLRAAVVREILSGICILPHISTDNWENLINNDLLGESLRIKDELPVEEAEKPDLVKLMKWSPTGLLWALNPDEVLCGHRRKTHELDTILVPDHIRYYRLQMLGFAFNDFPSAGFMALLHERYGLRELEFGRRALFKSQIGVELEMEVTDRTRIAQYDPSLGGGLVHVWMTASAPEPWDGVAVSGAPLTQPESTPTDDE